jgi:exosortase
MLLAAALAALFSFRSILGAPFESADDAQVEAWLFDPSKDSRAIAILVAAWLVWNRRQALVSCAAPRLSLGHVAAAAGVVSLFAWASWWDAPLLSMLCIYAFAATIAGAWGGAAGIRCVSLACVALLVSMPPPNPIFSEIIWWLQRITTQGSHLLLSLGGMPLVLQGTELHTGENVFSVIEACSGWRGISILVIVSLVASELHALPPLRTLAVASIAVPLGIALNIARVSAVILTKQELSSEQFESHTPQGIAVILAGSVVIYLTAYLLNTSSISKVDARVAADSPHQPAVPAIDTRARRRFGGFALGLALMLAVVSVLAPHLSRSLDRSAAKRSAPEFPLSAGAWRGTSIDPDYYFPYNSGAHPQFHAEFRRQSRRRATEVVDLFIAFESPQTSGLNRIPTSKLILPASNWTIESREDRRLSRLGVDTRVAILTRGDPAQLAYVIAWRLNDRGLVRESLFSLLGMDACAFGRAHCGRGVVRIAVPITEDSIEERDRALRTATDYIHAFHAPLFDLSEQ